MREPINENEIKAILKEIGIRIRAKRKEEETNYEVFARKNGINKVTLSRIENGENTSIKNLIIVANALGVSLCDIFKDY